MDTPQVLSDAVVVIPVSGVQKGLWFLDRLQPGRSTYNVVTAFDLRGDVQWNVLQQCVDLLVERHEALRTSFGAHDGQPVQLIHPKARVPIARATLAPGDDVEDRALQLAATEGGAPFDLTVAPLMRARAFTIAEERHVVVFTVHHLVCDGWSQSVLFMELGQLYAALVAGQPSPRLPLPIHHSELIQWRDQHYTPLRCETELAYWRSTLRDLPDPLELGADRPRPAAASGRGGLESWTIGPALTRELRQLCRAERVSMFMAFAAVLKVFLLKHSGQTDLIVGAPVAARPQPELERAVGFFANTIAIRSDLSGNPTFREVLQRVKLSSLHAYDHQDVPFFEVVHAVRPDRSMSQTPVFQVMCAAQRAPDVLLSLAGIDVRHLSVGNGTSKFDLLLDIQERRHEIDASFEYSSDLFEAATCRTWTGRFTTMLEAACARPELPIGSLPILTADELHTLDRWNDTAVGRNAAATIVSVFERQVTETPTAAAVSFAGEALSFHALDAQANQLAHALIARGVGPGDRVGICLERSLNLPAAILGVLKAGAAYVPLDPGYPPERLRFMVDDADLRVLLAPPQANLTVFGPVRDPREFADWVAASASYPITRPGIDVPPHGECYVMYTSGSTGRPKGVVMPHRALVNLVEWQRARSAPAMKTLQYSALSFDVSFQESFATWASGGQLVLVSESARRDPQELLRLLHSEGIERLFVPVVALQLLAETALEQAVLPLRLREVITAGEQLRITPAIRSFFASLPDARLDNQYGPTETHVVTSHMLTGSPWEWPELPPIGHPIANTRVHLLDDGLQPVPVGVRGELWISGTALALGYFGRTDETSARFRRVQIRGQELRVYQTGDAARHRADGTIEFLGRRDDQVKIRGFRVEPGEVEAVLEACPGVRRAVVVARPHAAGMRLVAYYVPSPGTPPTAAGIRTWLASKLPDYLVPAAFVPLTDLPLTASGKVDRRKLPSDVFVDHVRGTGPVAPADVVEGQLVAIWCDVLDLPSVGTGDRFFDVGGHSLAAARVFAQIKKRFNLDLPLSVLFDSPTVLELAALIRDRLAPPDGVRPVTPAAFKSLVMVQRGQGRTPLFFVHGGGGNVLNVRDLAGAMSPSQPVYGLQAAGVDGVSRTHETIEAMAEAYLAEVRTVQAHGPYLLAGYSAGGVVAYEMARRMSAEGEPIGLLALIDAFHPQVRLQPASMMYRLGRLRSEGVPYLRGVLERILARMHRHLQQPRDERLIAEHLAANEPIPFELRELHLFRSFERAARSYQPVPWSGHATLYRAEQTHHVFCDGGPTHGWDRVVIGGVTVVTVPGDHDTLLLATNVQRIASSMSVLMDVGSVRLKVE